MTTTRSGRMFRICRAAWLRVETREEVLHLIREAIEFHVEGLKQDGQPVPPPSSTSEVVDIAAA